MFSDLRILQGRKEPWLFFEGMRDNEQKGYELFYRYLISYSLFHYLVEGKRENDEGLNALERIKNAIRNLQTERIPDFFEVFAFKNNDGYVVVDQSNGCCPAIIYSSNQEREKKYPRDYAFLKSVNDVINNFDKLVEKFKKLKSLDDWTEDFQNQIRPLFTTKEDEERR
jgi:hypothetical protein